MTPAFATLEVAWPWAMTGHAEVISLAVSGKLATAVDPQAVVFAAAENPIPVKRTEIFGRSTPFRRALAFADADAGLSGTRPVLGGSGEVREEGEEKKSCREVEWKLHVELGWRWVT
ncbi:hypothetical protein MMC29_002393 [Sticta canariensis]|nr:hypothetical protein [Sticta canariensis]